MERIKVIKNLKLTNTGSRNKIYMFNNITYNYDILVDEFISSFKDAVSHLKDISEREQISEKPYLDGPSLTWLAKASLEK